MNNLKQILAQLHSNLAILREREAKYGGNAPLDLLNQISDHEQAIALTEQVVRDEITEAEWREALRRLLVNIRDRSESQPEICGVTIAGRDHVVHNNITYIINQAQSEIEEAERAHSIAQGRLAEGVRDYAQRLRDIPRRDVDAGGPYKGLLTYHLSDTELFFGREQAIINLLGCLKRGRLTVLHSESGTGKSSLLQAGISPRLLAEGHLPVYVRPYNIPPSLAIKRVFVPDLTATLELAQMPMLDFLRQVTGMLKVENSLYLLLDQFEEAFTLLSKDEQNSFVTDLVECLSDPGLKTHWVLAIRSEYFSNLADFGPQLENPFGNQYRLNRLNQAEARQVIVAPAERQGIAFESALVETILAELQDEKDELAPPQIQLVCSALYNLLLEQQRTKPDQPPLITEAMYQDEGQAKGILRGYLHQVINRTLPKKIERDLARRILIALISFDLRRQRLSHSELSQQLASGTTTSQNLDGLLEQLVKSRLLTAVRDEETGETNYELAHDYLLTEIELSPEEQARKAAAELLKQEVEHYKRYGKTRLSKDRYDIINSQREFLVIDQMGAELLRLSQEEIEAEARRELEQQRSLAEEQRRHVVWVSIAGLAAVILAIVAMIFWMQASQSTNAEASARAVVVTREAEAKEKANLAATREAEALQAKTEAQRQARIAHAGQMAAQVQAVLIRGEDPGGSLPLLLAREAVLSTWITDTRVITQAFVLVEADGALRTALDQAPPWRMTFPRNHSTAEILSAVFSPDGKKIVTAGRDGTAQIWQAEIGELLQTLKGHTGQVTAAVFSPDGKTIVTGSEDGTARVWLVSIGDLLKLAKKRIQREPADFTPAERVRFGIN